MNLKLTLFLSITVIFSAFVFGCGNSSSEQPEPDSPPISDSWDDYGLPPFTVESDTEELESKTPEGSTRIH